jgi:hypothetical protein
MFTTNIAKAYAEAKQKGSNGMTTSEGSPVEALISETIKRARERLIEGQGNELQKADSLQELLFLQMQGVKIDFLNFPISEIMMSENYSVKLMAYLAASQFWEPDAEVIMMVTSCINRDLLGSDPFRKSLALTIIPLIATPQFAESVVANVSVNFNNPREEIKQKAITCFYKLCLKYPECLPPGIKAMNIKGILTDKSNPPGVIQSALALVNELCLHNPSNYKILLPTIVTFFQDPSGSPWILVRALSIVSTIASTLEQKALEKFNQKITVMISEVLNFASSPSVVFEVIRLICNLRMNSRELVRTAADRAQSFIENEDPNLRYLGLISITRLMQFNQSIITLHRDTLMNCLDSDDQTCVFIAVDLLESIVTKKNIGEIVLNLVDQIEVRKPGIVRDTLVSRIISICKYGKETSYERFTDYEWYVNVLLTIHSFGFESKELSDELLTMALRAKSTRPVLVSEMLDFMENINTSETDFIKVAAFILGEYSDGDDAQSAFEFLISPKIESVKAPAQAVCIENAFKIYSKSQTDELLTERGKLLAERLPPFTASCYTEVQEIASMISSLNGIFLAKPNAAALASIYARPARAVDSSAQSQTPIPESLDLTKPIIDLDPQDNSFTIPSLDDEDEESPNAPNKSLFYLRSSSHKKQQEKKTDKVVVVQGSLGVKMEPVKKVRRLLPVIDDSATELMPVEKDSSKKRKPVVKQESAISHISFNLNEPSTETLPELKPYSQDEIIAKQSKQLLATRKSVIPSVSSDEVFKQIGITQGLSITVTDVHPRTNGVEIALQIVNTSPAIISAIEFTLDDAPPQALKSELAPSETVTHRVIYRTKPLLEAKIVKLTAIPTGGSGEMLRGKIRIVPTMFLSHAEQDEIDEIINGCNQNGEYVIGDVESVKTTIQRVADSVRGTIKRLEIDGQKAIAAVSKGPGDMQVSVLVYKKDDKFIADVRTNDSKLTESVIKELKIAFKPRE